MTLQDGPQFDAQTQKNINLWLGPEYDEKTREEVQRLIQNDPQKAIDAFYTSLSFGTGGLRGIVGVGTNRMNRYTVMTATQGLANYIKKQKFTKPSVFIGYDSRTESPFFAQVAAGVLAANKIEVYLCRHLRPTPIVSFGCRFYGCSAAIMITASHNPPYYNGYKVYWSDGGQVLPPHDQGIIEEVNKISGIKDIRVVECTDGRIRWVDDEVDQAYLRVTQTEQLYPEQNRAFGNELHVVYSNLHGAGITLVPEILARWGFHTLTLVPQQAAPDGTFPTVKSANPEERAAMQLGIDTLLQCRGDILLATDPDADRVGVGVRIGDQVILLTGNQIAAICLEHVCSALVKQKRMPVKGACVKTVVTTPLFQAIAKNYDVACFDVLPGFKHISAKIHEWEQEPNGHRFLFGGEESYGYNLGTASRDKDALILCALLCEIALDAKRRGKTIVDLLEELYLKYGIYREKLISVNFPETKKGRETIVQAMNEIRQQPPSHIGRVKVVQVKDFLRETQEPSDILSFALEDRSWAIVRPSGTEPKVKLYAGVHGHKDESIEACDQRLDMLLSALSTRLQESKDGR